MDIKELGYLVEHGDLNTNFFHQYANDMRLHNSKWEIKICDGVMVRDPGEIEAEVVRHFHSMYLDPKTYSII